MRPASASDLPIVERLRAATRGLHAAVPGEGLDGTPPGCDAAEPVHDRERGGRKHRDAQRRERGAAPLPGGARA